MTRVRIGLVALTATLVLTSCAYRAGTRAAKDWEAWVDDHPLRGAVATTAAGNASPFRGTLDVYAKLVVPPTSRAIEDAMADMCGFEKERSTPTTYWLLVDTRTTLQGRCDAAERTRLAAFFATVRDLDGVTRLQLSTEGLDAEIADSALPRVAGTVFAAADATGIVSAGSAYTVAGLKLHVDSVRGQDLTDELAVTGSVLAETGSALQNLKTEAGQVVAETTGTSAQAHLWEGAVTAPTGVDLTVLPDRVTASVPVHGAGRDLVDRTASDERVAAVFVGEDRWVLDVPGPARARAVVSGLGPEPGLGSLGSLYVDAGQEQDGVVRTCQVAPTYDDGVAAARTGLLLDLCARDDVPDVDDRGEPLDVRLTSDDVAAVLSVLHQLADGSTVRLRVEGATYAGTYELTVGDRLRFTQQSERTRQLETLWESLGPRP